MADRKRVREYQSPEWFFTDSENFLDRQWSLTANGPTIEEALDTIIDKIILIQEGKINRNLIGKQITQVGRECRPETKRWIKFTQDKIDASVRYMLETVNKNEGEERQ